MFGRRWRKFRRDVDADIGRLLDVGVDQAPVSTMLGGIDDLEEDLHEQFEHGCTALQAAVSTCAVMFACEIARTPELWPQARRIEQHLVEGGDCGGCELEAMMRRFLDRAEALLEHGLIDDRLFTFASTEILGTLEGLDPGERSTHRVVALFAEEEHGATAA